MTWEAEASARHQLESKQWRLGGQCGKPQCLINSSWQIQLKVFVSHQLLVSLADPFTLTERVN
jgi:hypothetical protein